MGGPHWPLRSLDLDLFPNASRVKTPGVRMGRRTVLLIVGFVMISHVHCQDALDNLEPAARLTCYECAADGCVTEEDLGVEKLCPAEAQVCFVGVGGGKVYRKCGIEQEVRKFSHCNHISYKSIMKKYVSDEHVKNQIKVINEECSMACK